MRNYTSYGQCRVQHLPSIEATISQFQLFVGFDDDPPSTTLAQHKVNTSSTPLVCRYNAEWKSRWFWFFLSEITQQTRYQWWNNVGPTSTRLGQHLSTIGWTSHIDWEGLSLQTHKYYPEWNERKITTDGDNHDHTLFVTWPDEHLYGGLHGTLKAELLQRFYNVRTRWKAIRRRRLDEKKHTPIFMLVLMAI